MHLLRLVFLGAALALVLIVFFINEKALHSFSIVQFANANTMLFIFLGISAVLLLLLVVSLIKYRKVKVEMLVSEPEEKIIYIEKLSQLDETRIREKLNRYKDTKTGVQEIIDKATQQLDDSDKAIKSLDELIQMGGFDGTQMLEEIRDEKENILNNIREIIYTLHIWNVKSSQVLKSKRYNDMQQYLQQNTEIIDLLDLAKDAFLDYQRRNKNNTNQAFKSMGLRSLIEVYEDLSGGF